MYSQGFERLTPAAPTHDSKPRYYGSGYDPVWLRGQLLLALRLLGWKRDGRSVNPVTGEIILAEASARVLSLWRGLPRCVQIWGVYAYLRGIPESLPQLWKRKQPAGQLVGNPAGSKISSRRCVRAPRVPPPPTPDDSRHYP